MSPISSVAPEFVKMAHRIVWTAVATSDPSGHPRTRVLHPIWEWDGTELTGWIATSPLSPKAHDLAQNPRVSMTYWAANQDTCTADADVTWETTDEQRAAGWARFANGPAPVGYDPAIVDGWDSPASPSFGILRIAPTRLRVMPGTLMLQGTGELLSWRREA